MDQQTPLLAPHTEAKAEEVQYLRSCLQFLLFRKELSERPPDDAKGAILETRLVNGMLRINKFRSLHFLLQLQISNLGQ